MKNYKAIIATVAAGLACTAVTSHAALTPLSPGQNGVPLTGIDYSLSGSPNLVASLTSGPLSTGPDTQTLVTQVYANDASNPWSSAGGLTFVYTITCTAGDITGLTVDGWIGAVAVANMNPGTAADANSVRYGLSGGNINFQWTADQYATTTLKVVVDTPMTSVSANDAAALDNQAVNLEDLAPVPEPTTIAAGALMLLPLGIGAVRSLRKERVS